jgi:hypothetical protein
MTSSVSIGLTPILAGDAPRAALLLVETRAGDMIASPLAGGVFSHRIIVIQPRLDSRTDSALSG